jgi:putative DNA primase/helicase
MRVEQRNSIRAALAHIPAHDRELWVRIGMAIKSALGEDGFQVWDQWSQQDAS